jgi:5-methyltetrahydropteroyltriglutamate--homocysteine methyltransferase
LTATRAAIAQGCNIVRGDLGLPSTYVPAADGRLQIDVVQTARASDSE